jgi:hypothetical protein
MPADPDNIQTSLYQSTTTTNYSNIFRSIKPLVRKFQ